MPKPIRRILARRQACITVLVALGLGLTLSAIEFGYELYRERQKIYSDVAQVVDMVQESAAQAAYEVNTTLMEKLVAGLTEYSAIVGAEIEDDLGIVLARRMLPDLGSSHVWLSRTVFGPEARFRRKLIHGSGNHEVGYLQVWIDTDTLLGGYLDRLGIALVFQGIRDVLLALLLALIFHFTITRPVLKVSEELAAVDTADPAACHVGVPPRHAKDELGLLARAINDLLTRLGQSLDDRREAEIALKESEERYRTLFETTGTAMVTLENNMMISLANRQFELLSGYSREAIEGRKRWTQFVLPEDSMWMKQWHIRRRMDPEGTPSRYEFRFLDRDRTVKQVLLTVHMIPGTDQSVASLLDISERKRSEEVLELYKLIVSISGDLMLYVDRDCVYRAANPRYCEARGLPADEIIGRSLSDIAGWETFENKIRPQLERAFSGEVVRFDEWFDFASLGNRCLAVTYYPFFSSEDEVAGVVINARDTTETKELEAQLAQAQKLEAVGRLAGGVAHDFNNMLSPILGFAELVFSELPEGSPHRDWIGKVLKAAERARDLTRQLLAFGRKQALAVRPLDLNRVVAGFEAMLRRTILEHVTIELRLAPVAAIVEVDQGQLEQILLNLALNAQDAMEGGGTLTVETAVAFLDEDYATTHPEVKPGRYGMLAVSDTGVGMTDDVREHVFEPFFTTKEAGKGTGLGLATVYGIVKQHGGHIWVYSEPGEGTTFKLYLPLKEGLPERVEAVEAESRIEGGTETVLVVEDQRQVRDLAVSALKRLGYEVLKAADGEQALEVAKDHPEEIHLLLTDVVMPVMNGKQLFEELRAVRPEVKVLYMSGYTDNVIAHHGVLDPGIHFVQKPFSVRTLAFKVRETLDG